MVKRGGVFEYFDVPNVPCGVESLLVPLPSASSLLEFLMYRVELKAQQTALHIPEPPQVPNVPCGVERKTSHKHFKPSSPWFLMYRVELKVG